MTETRRGARLLRLDRSDFLLERELLLFQINDMEAVHSWRALGAFDRIGQFGVAAAPGTKAFCNGHCILHEQHTRSRRAHFSGLVIRTVAGEAVLGPKAGTAPQPESLSLRPDRPTCTTSDSQQRITTDE